MKCDVLVVGAGISGLVAAQKASSDGLDTIIVERQPTVGFPYRKIDITEDAGIGDIVRELKLTVFDKSKKSKWFSPNNSFLLNSKISDLFIKRGKDGDSFENKTLARSLDLGCRLFGGIKSINFKFDEGGASEVICKSDRGNIVIAPTMVIWAGGSESIDLIGPLIGQKKRHLAYIKGFGITAGSLNVESGVTNIFLDEKNLPGGYFFLSKSRRGLGVASIVLECSKTKDINVNAYFRSFIKNSRYMKGVFKKSSNKKYFAGSCESFQLNRRSYKNILLIGNAAGLLDPLFGYGVNQAIYSGYWAARSVKENWGERNEMVCGEYEKGLNVSLLPAIKTGMKMRIVFDSLKNRHFDRLIGTLDYISDEIDDVDDFLNNPIRYPLPIVKSVIKEPRVLGLMRYIVRMF